MSYLAELKRLGGRVEYEYCAGAFTFYVIVGDLRDIAVVDDGGHFLVAGALSDATIEAVEELCRDFLDENVLTTTQVKPSLN